MVGITREAHDSIMVGFLVSQFEVLTKGSALDYSDIMLFIQFGMPIIGALVILLGALEFNKKYVDWNVKFFNSARGVKTKITSTTYSAHKATGITMIILGLALIVFSIFLSNSLQSYL